jgi:hypothetical protein
MTKEVGEWEPVSSAKKVGEWEPVAQAASPVVEKNAPRAEEVLARLNAAIAAHDYVGIAAAQEEFKAANQARVASGQAPLPMPSLTAPAPARAVPAQERDDSTSSGMPMSAQRALGALAGATTGFSAGMGPAAAKAYIAKKALDKLLPDRVDPALTSGELITQKTPLSSPFTPSSTPSAAVTPTIPMQGAPAVDYGDTPYQRELNQQEGAHQRSARNKTISDDLSKVGLNVNRPVADFANVKTTRGGILAPADVVENVNQAQQDAQTARLNAAANARSQRQQSGLAAATQAGSQWQDLYRRGQELASSAEADSKKLGNVLKQKALDWWRTGIPPLQNWAGRAASAGAGIGFAAPGAVEKMQNNDNAGALQELGTGAAVGTALSYVPQKAAGPLNMGLQGMDSIARGSKGDYLGSTLSALGAVGPYAAAALFPEVAIPAALATATIPPAINLARDYYLRHYGTLQGALPTQ